MFAGFAARVSWSDRRIVNVAWVRVADILDEAGLAAMPEQKLAVKLEIDTRPPQGATLRTTVVQRHVLFAVRAHMVGSLMAGKVHALWTRRYPKGRDWFDLIWYRSQTPRIEPNLELLAAALLQTHPPLAARAVLWRGAGADRAHRLDPERLKADVIPFLERPTDAALLTPAALADLLEPGQA